MMKKAPSSTVPWIIGRSAFYDRVVREPADAGDVEHGLDQDRAAEQDPDVEPGGGDDRRDRAAQAVAEDHAPLAEPLRARRANVVLGHHLDHAAAHQPRVEGGERGREHEPRHDQRPEPQPRVLRERHVAARAHEEVELPDVVREQIEGDQAEPVDRRRDRDQRQPIVTRSSAVRLLTAEMTPIVIPSRSQITAAPMATEIDAGSRSKIWSLTG